MIPLSARQRKKDVRQVVCVGVVCPKRGWARLLGELQELSTTPLEQTCWCNQLEGRTRSGVWHATAWIPLRRGMRQAMMGELAPIFHMMRFESRGESEFSAAWRPRDPWTIWVVV